MYTCGIIVESLENKDVLQELKAHFAKERLQQVPGAEDRHPLDRARVDLLERL
jgi:hypothetical protein